MVKRRTLDEGLTPEEEAFLKPEKNSRPVAQKHAQVKTSLKPETEVKQVPEIPVQPAVPIFTPPPPSVGSHSNSGLVPLNSRLAGDISSALLTASLQRKIMRQTPFTQQDIISEALIEWLQKHGYLPRS